MFIGIDGTSTHWDYAQYVAELHGSFISQLVASTREEHALYLRGPTTSGIQDRAIAATALEAMAQWQRSGDRRVVLAGYSRGGAVAIRIAQRLREEPWARELTIDCLALFDAVDRDPLIDATTVPGNVHHAYHALRDPAVGSRAYFGNCGTTIEYPGRLIRRSFFATHSALGGVPWGGDHPTQLLEPGGSRPESPYAVLGSNRCAGPGMDPAPAAVRVPAINRVQDHCGALAVKQWMWGHLRRHGVVA